jgi:predicted RNA-binding protein with PIN domain
MAEATLYLFDGYNLLHAGPFSDRRALADRLASFVALKGARGIVVFDGAGDDEELGPLSVRFAPDADTLLERLAVQYRRDQRVAVVSSDATLSGTVGREVVTLSARTFFRDLVPPVQRIAPAGGLADKLDAATRARLERLRRGE